MKTTGIQDLRDSVHLQASGLVGGQVLVVER